MCVVIQQKVYRNTVTHIEMRPQFGCLCGVVPVSLDHHRHVRNVSSKCELGGCPIQPPHFTF